MFRQPAGAAFIREGAAAGHIVPEEALMVFR
jgi:hypothetical protein